MRKLGVLVVLAFVAGSSGCCMSFLEAGVRNGIELPIQACDQKRLEWRNRHRAEQAWATCERGSDGEWTKDYKRGFIDGYSEYLTGGGNGEPPASPPFRYRLRRYQTPDGLRAIEDWYAGYRHGASIAQVSGLRETIVIPLSQLPGYATNPYPTMYAPSEPPLAPPIEPEELKPPRKLTRSN